MFQLLCRLLIIKTTSIRCSGGGGGRRAQKRVIFLTFSQEACGYVADIIVLFCVKMNRTLFINVKCFSVYLHGLGGGG